MLNWLSEAVVATEQGTAIKTRAANVRRIPESERWDADRVLGIRAVPWSPDGSDNAFDIQVGMERPAKMVRLLSGEVLMVNKVPRTYFRRADFERCGLSEGCLGCRYLGTGQGDTKLTAKHVGGELTACGKMSRLDPHDWRRLTRGSIEHWLKE